MYEFSDQASAILWVHAIAAPLVHLGLATRHGGWRGRIVNFQEGLSAYLIYWGLFAYYASLLSLSLSPDSFQYLAWPRLVALELLGLGLLLLQMVFLVLAPLALRESWSASVFTHAAQHLVDHGIYSRIRHPIYAGVLFWAAGAPLVANNALLLSLAPAAVGVLLRVPVEERLLKEKFGRAYEAYASRTRRFL